MDYDLSTERNTAEEKSLVIIYLELILISSGYGLSSVRQVDTLPILNSASSSSATPYFYILLLILLEVHVPLLVPYTS
jgi:hypothetical protein